MADETRAEAPTAEHEGGWISYEQFLEQSDEDTFAEWVDGRVVPMSPVSDAHQDVGGLLLSVLRAYVEERAIGVVRHDPFQMKVGPKSSRAPDILFLAKANLSRLTPHYLDGPADLVVEIIGPGSGRVDRGDKYYEYEEGGVREYWLLDPQRQQADFYQLDEGGVFRPVLPDDQGIYRSAVLDGLWLNVDWLWQKPLPPLTSVLKEWGLV
jgi:Uma2 family endonuclease